MTTLPVDSVPVLPVNEFPRPYEVEQIPARGISVTLTANAAECAAVAQRLGLLAVNSLAAELSVIRLPDSPILQATGQFTAAIVQECVVSLTPLPANVQENVRAAYMPPHLISEEDGIIESGALDEVSESIINGEIDLGELVVQHLALALDPYPRQPDVVPVLPKAVSGEAKQNPFAGLATLLKPKDDGAV